MRHSTTTTEFFDDLDVPKCSLTQKVRASVAMERVTRRRVSQGVAHIGARCVARGGATRLISSTKVFSSATERPCIESRDPVIRTSINAHDLSVYREQVLKLVLR